MMNTLKLRLGGHHRKKVTMEDQRQPTGELQRGKWRSWLSHCEVWRAWWPEIELNGIFFIFSAYVSLEQKDVRKLILHFHQRDLKFFSKLSFMHPLFSKKLPKFWKSYECFPKILLFILERNCKTLSYSFPHHQIFIRYTLVTSSINIVVSLRKKSFLRRNSERFGNHVNSDKNRPSKIHFDENIPLNLIKARSG